jgi:hypothetical protein
VRQEAGAPSGVPRGGQGLGLQRLPELPPARRTTSASSPGISSGSCSSASAVPAPTSPVTRARASTITCGRMSLSWNSRMTAC